MKIKFFTNQNWLYWLPALSYMVLIFILSSFPAPEIVKKAPIYWSIKPVHIVEYGILSSLILYALLKTTRNQGWKLYGLIAILVLGYGMSDELHQHFVPGRSGQLIDLVANLMGTGLMCACHNLARRLRAMI